MYNITTGEVLLWLIGITVIAIGMTIKFTRR